MAPWGLFSMEKECAATALKDERRGISTTMQMEDACSEGVDSGWSSRDGTGTIRREQGSNVCCLLLVSPPCIDQP